MVIQRDDANKIKSVASLPYPLNKAIGVYPLNHKQYAAVFAKNTKKGSIWNAYEVLLKDGFRLVEYYNNFFQYMQGHVVFPAVLDKVIETKSSDDLGTDEDVERLGPSRSLASSHFGNDHRGQYHDDNNAVEKVHS